MQFDRKKLQEALKDKNMGRLAKSSGVPHYKFQRAKQGKDITVGTFYEVCGALGMSPDDFTVK